MRTRRRRRHGRRAGKKKNLSRRALALKRRRSSLKKRRARNGQIQARVQANPESTPARESFPVPVYVGGTFVVVGRYRLRTVAGKLVIEPDPVVRSFRLPSDW